MKTKFRAWDKYLKKIFHNVNPIFDADGNLDFIIYEYECTGYNMTEIGIEKWDAYMAHEKGIPVELMQYTGLNDSEGTKIYKGDIAWDDVRERYGVVDFIDGKFGFVSENDYEDLCEVCNDIVIRGNIYQNKELLEGE